MPPTTEVKVPDIGDFGEVEIIEVAVAPGDRVELEQGLITLESDKATMDVPSPAAGIVTALAVSVGDKVSQGSLILTLEATAEATAPGGSSAAPESAADESQAALAAAPPAVASGDADVDADVVAQVVVIGAGPGGYTAAFRAADLGQKTVLIERYPTLGGVCLNVGCIPSKALLHTAEIINGAAAMAEHGVDFGKPEITLAKLAAWKDTIVAQLTKGLAGLARQRKVQVLHGVATFISPHMLQVNDGDGIVRMQASRDGDGVVHLVGVPRRLGDEPDQWTAILVNLPHSGGGLARGLKVSSRLTMALAGDAAREAGVEEALLLDGNGWLVEGSRSNILVVTDADTLVTPPLTLGAVAGLARTLVLERVPSIVERAVSADELRSAKEIIAVNAVRAARPITKLDGKPIGDGAVGAWSKRLSEVLEAD